MEPSPPTISGTQLYFAILGIFVIAPLILRVIFRSALGIPAEFALPAEWFVILLAIWPLIKRLPVRDGRKPLTLTRWALLSVTAPVLIFVGFRLIDQLMGTD